MTHITLTSDQAAIIRDAATPVLIHDPQGLVVGVLDRSTYHVESARAFTAEECAEAQRILTNETNWYTTAELLEHLEKLAPSKPQ